MATKKLTWGTKYGEKIKNYSPAGAKIQVEHTPHMGLDGRRKLVKDNPKPIYEMIQASREQCEIERIVKRALNGDMTALNAIEGHYMDITGAPRSLAQAQQIIINAKNDFDKLDAETKKKFDNNVEIFIAEAGTKEWCDKLGITEKLEREAKAEAEKTQYEKNLHDAMANLAKGNVNITNAPTEEGGNINE